MAVADVNSGRENYNCSCRIGDDGFIEVEKYGGEVGNSIAGAEICFGLDAITNKSMREGFVGIAID
jgi:hypothetical protein